MDVQPNKCLPVTAQYFLRNKSMIYPFWTFRSLTNGKYFNEKLDFFSFKSSPVHLKPFEMIRRYLFLSIICPLIRKLPNNLPWRWRKISIIHTIRCRIWVLCVSLDFLIHSWFFIFIELRNISFRWMKDLD